jgi:hypothetical protein
MPGLVLDIHVLLLAGSINKKDGDGRDKPGHDEKRDPSIKPKRQHWP